jgi:hypothetical protein
MVVLSRLVGSQSSGSWLLHFERQFRYKQTINKNLHRFAHARRQIRNVTIDSRLSWVFFLKKIYLQNRYEYVYVCMHHGPVWMHTITNDGNNLFDFNTVLIFILEKQLRTWRIVKFIITCIFITNSYQNLNISWKP